MREQSATVDKAKVQACLDAVQQAIRILDDVAANLGGVSGFSAVASSIARASDEASLAWHRVYKHRSAAAVKGSAE